MSKVYNELRKKVYSIIYPGGIPLEFGCDILVWKGCDLVTYIEEPWEFICPEKKGYYRYVDEGVEYVRGYKKSDWFINLWPDLELRHILLALDENKVESYIKIENDCGWWRDLILWLEDYPYWDKDKYLIPLNLSKPIKEQDEEVLKNINDLLND